MELHGRESNRPDSSTAELVDVRCRESNLAGSSKAELVEQHGRESNRLGSSKAELVDNVLRYSNRADLVGSLSVILERIAVGDSEDVGTVPDHYLPRRAVAQTHQLTELQQQAIFAAYRRGVGPRVLGGHYGVTERAIKYLVKKHGIQRGQLPGVIGGRA